MSMGFILVTIIMVVFDRRLRSMSKQTMECINTIEKMEKHD